MRSGANRFGLGIICSFVCITLADDARAQAVSGLSAIRVASGLSSPLFSTAPPGDFNRLFIVQQNGVIRILNLNTGVLNATPFLTVGGIVSGGEQGLLGLAFDPSYATNGKFYVNYTAPGGAFNAGITKIIQYQVSSNPDIADTTATNIKTLLSFDQPQTNHNGGWIGFSPRSGDAKSRVECLCEKEKRHATRKPQVWPTHREEISPSPQEHPYDHDLECRVQDPKESPPQRTRLPRHRVPVLVSSLDDEPRRSRSRRGVGSSCC